MISLNRISIVIMNAFLALRLDTISYDIFNTIEFYDNFTNHSLNEPGIGIRMFGHIFLIGSYINRKKPPLAEDSTIFIKPYNTAKDLISGKSFLNTIILLTLIK